MHSLWSYCALFKCTHSYCPSCPPPSLDSHPAQHTLLAREVGCPRVRRSTITLQRNCFLPNWPTVQTAIFTSMFGPPSWQKPTHLCLQQQAQDSQSLMQNSLEMDNDYAHHPKTQQQFEMSTDSIPPSALYLGLHRKGVNLKNEAVVAHSYRLGMAKVGQGNSIGGAPTAKDLHKITQTICQRTIPARDRLLN